MNRETVVGDGFIVCVRKSPAMWTRQSRRSLRAWAILIESRRWDGLAFQKTLGVLLCIVMCGRLPVGRCGAHVGERDVGPMGVVEVRDVGPCRA